MQTSFLGTQPIENVPLGKTLMMMGRWIPPYFVESGPGPMLRPGWPDGELWLVGVRKKMAVTGHPTPTIIIFFFSASSSSSFSGKGQGKEGVRKTQLTLLTSF